MKFEKTEVSGFENAILGCRLPMCKDLDDAKSKSDSKLCDVRDCRPEKCASCSCYENARCKYNTTKEYSNVEIKYCIGKDDLRIVHNLINADSNGNAGQPNSKFLRMIHVQVCITAPLYWWKEFDTYKIGTTANSTSTMHKLASTPITMDCFEIDDFENVDVNEVPINFTWNIFIGNLEQLRQKYNETKDKRYWKELIRLLPESWLQTRMIDLDYATLRNIVYWRANHKLTEWHKFCDWAKTLPYAEDLLFEKTI